MKSKNRVATCFCYVSHFYIHVFDYKGCNVFFSWMQFEKRLKNIKSWAFVFWFKRYDNIIPNQIISYTEGGCGIVINYRNEWQMHWHFEYEAYQESSCDRVWATPAAVSRLGARGLLTFTKHATFFFFHIPNKIKV